MAPKVRLEEATGRKMITKPGVAMAAAMASSAEATATVPALEAHEVVTQAVATAVAPATRVVLIAKVTEKWSRRRTPSSCRA